MNTLKNVLMCAALLSVTVFMGSLTFVTLSGWNARSEVGKAVGKRVDPVVASLTKQVDGDPSAKSPDDRLTMRAAALARVDKVSDNANAQLHTLQGTMKDALKKADSQLTAMEKSVDGAVNKVDAQITVLQGTTKDVVSKVDPVLDAYTKLGQQATGAVADARSTAASYSDDFDNLVQSSEVAVTSVARASDNVAQEMPKYTKQIERVGDSAVKVGDAAAAEAAEFTKPQTTKQKIESWLSIIPRVVKLIL